MRAPPGKGPPGGAGPGGGENLLANGGLTGGWVCTKCGVHIIPNDKSQVSGQCILQTLKFNRALMY